MKMILSAFAGIVYASMIVVLSGCIASSPSVPMEEQVRPLLNGRQLPAAKLVTPAGEQFDLAAAVRAKPTVLIFYRGGWCPFCNRHLKEISGVEPDLLDLGYQILAVSPDQPEKLKETVGKQKISYTLLSDSSMAFAHDMGIAFRVSPDYLKKLTKHGIDLGEYSGQDHRNLPVPAVFIISTDGIVRFQHVNPDYKVRLKADVLLAAARAVKSQEKMPK